MHNNLRKLIRKTLLENVDNINYELMPISKRDMPSILKLCDNAFNHQNVFKCTDSRVANRINFLIDFEKSIKMVVDGKIVGFYLLSTKESIEEFIWFVAQHGVDMNILKPNLLEELKRKKGIQGLSVGVSEQLRNKGLGKILLDYPKSLGLDYIWGVQTEGASDIDKWLKRRIVIAEGPSVKITVEMF